MALLSPLRYQSRTMKQKVVALLVLAFCAMSPVFGGPDTPETRRREAERYLQVSPPKALFEDMADKMAANLPPDQREQFKKVMTTQLDIAALTKAMMDAMVKNFTTDELKVARFAVRRSEIAATKSIAVRPSDHCNNLSNDGLGCVPSAVARS